MVALKHHTQLKFCMFASLLSSLDYILSIPPQHRIILHILNLYSFFCSNLGFTIGDSASTSFLLSFATFSGFSASSNLIRIFKRFNFRDRRIVERNNRPIKPTKSLLSNRLNRSTDCWKAYCQMFLVSCP